MSRTLFENGQNSFEMKCASVNVNVLGKIVYLRDGFRVEPFTFRLEICQFELKVLQFIVEHSCFDVVVRIVPWS